MTKKKILADEFSNYNLTSLNVTLTCFIHIDITVTKELSDFQSMPVFWLKHSV